MSVVDQLVEKARQDGASDIHLICGLPPKYRKDGQLEDMFPKVLTAEDCEHIAHLLAGDSYREMAEIGELDLADTYAGSRCRVHIFRQQGVPSVALRLLREKIPDLTTLGLPPAALELPGQHKGIILVTGETGSGKSTTLAAMLDYINHHRKSHIVTLEDPIEYLYKPDLCAINQREIGKDTRSFADGLRASLREDPNVILIGEMRDAETIETAITAAETGHLVFGTLHSGSASDAVDRIVQVFPEGMQTQIRLQLSMTLQAVLTQQAPPSAGRPWTRRSCVWCAAARSPATWPCSTRTTAPSCRRTRSDAAGKTDCHVASLLAMTCFVLNPVKGKDVRLSGYV